MNPIHLLNNDKMKKRTQTTHDAVEILQRRYINGDLEKLAELQAIREEDAAERKIYDLKEPAAPPPQETEMQPL